MPKIQSVQSAYVGNFRFQLYDPLHLFPDEGLVDGQPTVGADQLRQVNHELLVGPTCL